MKIRFLSIALQEVHDAIDYYEEADSGLGLRFMGEFRSCVERIRTHPRAWAKLSRNTHRCRTKVFPYGVIYQIRKDEILVVAVMHMSKERNYWKNRI